MHRTHVAVVVLFTLGALASVPGRASAGEKEVASAVEIIEKVLTQLKDFGTNDYQVNDAVSNGLKPLLIMAKRKQLKVDTDLAPLKEKLKAKGWSPLKLKNITGYPYSLLEQKCGAVNVTELKTWFFEPLLDLGLIVRLETKTCSKAEWMADGDSKNWRQPVTEKCTNLDEVKGGCGAPSLLDTIGRSDNAPESAHFGSGTNLHEFIAALDQLPNPNFNLHLIMGATWSSAFSEKKGTKPNDLAVLINPDDLLGEEALLHGDDPEKRKAFRLNPRHVRATYEDLVAKLKDASIDYTKIYIIRDTPPLNSDDVLINSAASLGKKIPIYVYNRLCPTCFRTFYKLVKYANVQYDTSPESMGAGGGSYNKFSLTCSD